jgi:hypothetical protein
MKIPTDSGIRIIKIVLVDEGGFFNNFHSNKDRYKAVMRDSPDYLLVEMGIGVCDRIGWVKSDHSRGFQISKKEWKFFELYEDPLLETGTQEVQAEVISTKVVQLGHLDKGCYIMVMQERYEELLRIEVEFNKIKAMVL